MKLKTHRGAAKRFKITSTGQDHALAFRQAAPVGHQEAAAHAQVAQMRWCVNPSDVRNIRLALAVRHRIVFVAARERGF